PPPLQPPASGTGRPSAVLMLFGETEGEPDLLIVQRSPWLRRHAGQPAFPGGAIEAADQGPVGAALREAAEEAGVDPAGGGGSPPCWWTGCWRSAAGSGPGTRGPRKTSRPMCWSPPRAASAGARLRPVRNPPPAWYRICDNLVAT